MRTSSIITAALFVVFLLIVLVWLVSQERTDFIEAPAKLAQLRHAIGLFIATAAALALLLRALAGDAAGKMIALTIAVLAGILLIEPNWGVALGLAAVTLGVALRAWLPVPHRRMPNTPPVHDPPAL
ncbi:MAG: hypothetical protein M3552_14000 [Planctomycetota bacterium]|nr:hypothetical protein [Planctomycetota bacterium]